MSISTGAWTEQDMELHALLLRLAGRIPDELLTRCRDWAADGRRADLAFALTFTLLSRAIRMGAEDVELLGDLLSDADTDQSILSDIELTDNEPMNFYQFLPIPDIPQARADDLLAQAILAAETAEDPADLAAIDAVAGEAGVRGLWRAWRHPALSSPWPPPRRVYVVEADHEIDFLGLTAGVQQRIAAAGEGDPQVEVVPAGVELPPYQSSARAYGSLLWASTPEGEFRLAEPFDEVSAETGPAFRPDHPRIDDPVERNRILHYLQSAEAVLVTEGMMDDIIDPTSRGVVPLDLRTDGRWIWTDITTYYLQEHHLAPPEELLVHIRAADYGAPDIDGVAVHRAAAYVLTMAQDAQADERVTAEPETAEPETAEPETAEPETAEPKTAEPKPVITKPVTAAPVIEPAVAEPVKPVKRAKPGERVKRAKPGERVQPTFADGGADMPVGAFVDDAEIAALKDISTIKVTAGGPATPVL
jgi:hypothetical protein